MKVKTWIGAITLGVLVACGGGGGGAVAPVAESPAGTNQLAAAISLQGTKSLMLQTASAQQVAAWSKNEPILAVVKNKLNDGYRLALNAISSTAHAQSSSSSSSSQQQSSSAATTCNVKQLVSVGADGTSKDLFLTSADTSSDCVGVTDMFDGKNYILLAAEGVYKDGKTCNIVFVQKSTGDLFCLGESKRSRYSFTKKNGSDYKRYDILQATENGKYIFLEAKVDLFDDQGIKTGELVKIIRFDLTDEAKGPAATTVLEAENTNWYTNSASNDSSYIYINGYSAMENGDVAATYYFNLYNNNFSSSSYKNESSYFSYNATTGEFDQNIIDLSSLNTGSSSWNWSSLQCYLSSDETGFYFVYNGNSGLQLVKGVFDSTTKSLALTSMGSTQLCSSWTPGALAKAKGAYYGTTGTTSNWSYDATTGYYVGTNTVTLYRRVLSANADETVASTTTNRQWSNPSVNISSDGNIAIVSLGASTTSSCGSSGCKTQNIGAEIFKYDISAGNTNVTANRILASTDNLWITAISNIATDGVLQFAGRDMSKAFYSRVDVVIDASGQKTVTKSEIGGSQTLAVVRL